jgi:hypothetical protein
MSWRNVWFVLTRLPTCGSAGEMACCCGVWVVGHVVRPLRRPALSRLFPAVRCVGGAPQRRGVALPIWMSVAAVCGGMAHRAQPRSRVAGCPVHGGAAGCFAVGLCDALHACARPNSDPATEGRRGVGGRLIATTVCRQPRRCVSGHRDRQRLSGRGMGGTWRTSVAVLAQWRAYPSVQLRVRPVLHSCALILHRPRIMRSRDGRAAVGCGVPFRYHAAHARSWAICAFETASARDAAISDPGMCGVPATRARRACGIVCLVAACAVGQSSTPIGTGCCAMQWVHAAGWPRVLSRACTRCWGMCVAAAATANATLGSRRCALHKAIGVRN